MSTHEQEPQVDQFKCETCGQTFNSRAELTEHQRAMHPAESHPYRCDACGQTFNTEKELKVHLRLMHPERERIR